MAPILTLLRNADEISNKDTVVFLMGPTGAGKSTFIDTVTMGKYRFTGDHLHSETHRPQAVRISNHPQFEGVLVLVDTPGFDDTYMSDFEVLSMVGKWFERAERKGVMKLGLLYFHRITDNRMSGSALKTLRMFGKVSGDKAARQAVFVTTMWDRLQSEGIDLAQRREEQLIASYWQDLIHYGATFARFHKTEKSALAILDIIHNVTTANHVKVLLQEELVDRNLHLPETQAGQTLYNSLQLTLSTQMQTLRQLSEHIKEANPEMSAQLDEEYNKAKSDLNRTFEDVKHMKIPLHRQIALLFTRRTEGRALNLGTRRTATKKTSR